MEECENVVSLKRLMGRRGRAAPETRESKLTWICSVTRLSFNSLIDCFGARLDMDMIRYERENLSLLFYRVWVQKGGGAVQEGSAGVSEKQAEEDVSQSILRTTTPYG